MKSVCIISCTAHKRTETASAEELYSSELFYKSRRYAHANFDRWLIFSAKHGLIEPGKEVAPYDQSIDSIGPADRKDLAARVKRQVNAITRKFDEPIRFTSLCGRSYNDVLAEAGIPFNEIAGFDLPIGKKLKALTTATDPLRTETDLERLYKAIRPLLSESQLRPLSSAVQSKLPNSGVYLFFDHNERRLRDNSQHRIVRVGTHGVANGSKASLRDRIRTHFGTMGGDGNHRSSIFRLHVGRSLINCRKSPDIESWGNGKIERLSSEELALERAVSKYLSKLHVAFIDIPGESEKSNDRAYIEQNLIALVSNSLHPLDPPSHQWLGNYSEKAEIRKSALWNVNHTLQGYDPAMFDILSYYVGLSTGAKKLPSKPQTPPDWLNRVRQDARQLNLL